MGSKEGRLEHEPLILASTIRLGQKLQKGVADSILDRPVRFQGVNLEDLN